jgi:cytochrome c peroxidase
MDIGTTTAPHWTEGKIEAPFTASELPVFKVTCHADAKPHPLGRVIYTTDPGRALISGRCADVGSIVMQQLRGLSARAPYFANGSAETLHDVVEFYNRRYQMKLTEADKADLVHFLEAL